MKNYDWMQPDQKQLFENFCKAFDVKSISDIGRKLHLKNPYHGGYQLFRNKKPSRFLKVMIESKKKDLT